MKGVAAADWPALSALYDELSTLAPEARAAELARLQRASHPLLQPLQGLLAAADLVETGDFLDTMPRLEGLHGGPGDGDPDADDAPEWRAGQQVGPYRLEALLGQGGMAEVWRARRARQDDGSLRRHVALKLPHRMAQVGAVRASWARRFERERDILAALRHPNIAGLLDAGVSPDGQAWLALEYVEGETLIGWCDERRLTIPQRVALFRQVLLAVQHAHAQLVLHRDLKPGNILVTPDGQVRLLDFGIAKLMSPDDAVAEVTELTQQAGRFLTPSYASPEQLLGQPLGTASDVYALGVILYELLSGLRPYELRRATAAELERAVLEQEPRAPSRREPDDAAVQARAPSRKAWRRLLAPELDAVVLRALAKSPRRRYTSVDALLADVDRWLEGEPVLARRPSAALRVRKFIARHRLGVGLGAGAVVGLMALTGVAVLQGLRAQEESRRAVATRDFLMEVFRRADPSESRGVDPTPRELLSWGRDRALATLHDQPALQADVLRSIGEVQVFQADYVAADQSLKQAEERNLALGRRTELAWVRLDRVFVALSMGRTEQAGDLLAQVDTEFPRSPPAELRVWYFQMHGEYASRLGDIEVARRHLEQALQQARDVWGPRHPRIVDLLRALADAEVRSRHFVSGMQRLDEASEVAASLPNVEAVDRAALALERAIAQRGAGRYPEALATLAMAAPACEQRLGPTHENCELMQHLAATLHLCVGNVDAAQALLPKVYARSMPHGSPRREAEALVISARIAARSGTGSPELWMRVEALARGETSPVPDEEHQLAAAQARAESLLREGDVQRALTWIERAEQLSAAAPSLQRPYAAATAVLRGHALLLQHQDAEALSQHQRAAELAAQSWGADHAQTAVIRLNQISPLRNLGREIDAQRLWQEVREQLRPSLSPDAPLWQSLNRELPLAVPVLWL